MSIDDAYLDKLLTDALYRAAELDYMEEPTEEELDNIIHPSNQFKRKMSTLLRNPQSYIRSHQKPVIIRVIRVAAAVFVACIVLFATTMAVSPTVRAAVVGFVRTWFEDRTTYQIPDRDLSAGLTFSYIPDGFVLLEEIDLDIQLIYIFQSVDSITINVTVSSGKLIVDNEDSFYYSTTTNDFPVEVYERIDDEKLNVIIVHHESRGVYITLESEIEVAELLLIAESIG